MTKSSLPWSLKLSYGVGHFLNDLCAAMWFSYILLFYESVLEFNKLYAGYIMLIGQIADGLSTPVVGILADKENRIPLCARYGRRKVFHLLGTVLVIISFPFIFNECLGCESSSWGVKLGFHAVFVVIFQFAWACVQVSHLALIPELANTKSQRTELNSIRYAFMVLANMLVFVITFIFLGIDEFEDDITTTRQMTTEMTTGAMTSSPLNFTTTTPKYEEVTGGIGPQHLESFRNVALTCVGIGTVFSIIFHVGTPEPQYHSQNQSNCEAIEKEGKEGEQDKEEGEEQEDPILNKTQIKSMRKRDWFKMPTFYQVAIMYTLTRLYVNLYMTYIPQFVDKTLGMLVVFVAVIPMLMHFSSFLGSFVMKPVNRIIGRKRTFSIGCTIGLTACMWIGLGQNSQIKVWGIYPIAILLGIGGSVLLITSLSITADLIGDNKEGGAFVYGFMSLLDKVSNGIVIMVIQNEESGQPNYYQRILSIACGVPCILGVLITLTLYKSRVGSSPQKPMIVVVNTTIAIESESSPGGVPSDIHHPEANDHNGPSHPSESTGHDNVAFDSS